MGPEVPVLNSIRYESRRASTCNALTPHWQHHAMTLKTHLSLTKHVLHQRAETMNTRLLSYCDVVKGNRMMLSISNDDHSSCGEAICRGILPLTKQMLDSNVTYSVV